MKAPISNSSSWDSTHSSELIHSRLYILTGKGGVGKTTLALALTKYLQLQGKNVLYNSFDQAPSVPLCDKLEINSIKMNIAESTQAYIANKLGSEIVASWIMKTPFFSSLFNMLPGIGYMIFFGHIIHQLKTNPDLIIVVDTPSSGHALTMFESPQNFKKIFKKGIIVDDIDRMLSFANEGNNIKVYISSLPTMMAINEGIEMREHLHELDIKNINVIMNNSIKEMPELTTKRLPSFLKKKINLEEDVINRHGNEVTNLLPHIIDLEQFDIIKRLVPYMEHLV